MPYCLSFLYIRYIINLIFLFFPVFVDRGSGNEKGLLEGKKSNELSSKTDTGNVRSWKNNSFLSLLNVILSFRLKAIVINRVNCFEIGNNLLGAKLENDGNYVFQGGFGKSFKGALPAKFIRTTSVRPKTLSPVWNERFRL